MYYAPKQVSCLGSVTVNAVSRTALGTLTIPERCDQILIQCIAGTFYYSDSPSLPTDLVADGLRITASGSVLYVGDRSNFYFLGNAVLYFYTSR